MKIKSNVQLLAVLTLFGMVSCAPTYRITNVSPIYLKLNPSISTFQDPDANMSKYKTFSVFPYSEISEEVKMNEILERQILFYLRNIFEMKGYNFVEFDQNPDFLATINVSSEYDEYYVPPSAKKVPVWVPGQTITTYGSTSGSFSFNSYGSSSTSGWGNYSGTSTSTTYVPGYMTTQTYIRSGYTQGNYFPAVSIQVYDAKTFKNVWLGTGAGTSDISDVRISGQLVIEQAMSRFPNTPNTIDTLPSGMPPIKIGIYTNDGNAYFPTVVLISRDAASRGMELYDMVLSVEGTPVMNKPFSEVVKLFHGEPCTDVRLEIWRLNHKREITLPRLDQNNRISCAQRNTNTQPSNNLETLLKNLWH